MKIILTGCTGFIGGEVLSQSLLHPSITSIIALSRRQLPASISQDPKLEVIIMKDLKIYPEAVLQKIRDADACIWCMGTTAGDRELEIDCPLAFGDAMSSMLARKGGAMRKFRYIQLSGAATERDQSKTLWFKGEMRNMKGQAELNMLAYAKKLEMRNLWSTLVVKSGFVVQSTVQSPRDAMGLAMGSGKYIRVNELAAVMVDAALDSGVENGVDTLSDCGEMVTKGRMLLEKQAEANKN